MSSRDPGSPSAAKERAEAPLPVGHRVEEVTLNKWGQGIVEFIRRQPRSEFIEQGRIAAALFGCTEREAAREIFTTSAQTDRGRGFKEALDDLIAEQVVGYRSHQGYFLYERGAPDWQPDVLHRMGITEGGDDV